MNQRWIHLIRGIWRMSTLQLLWFVLIGVLFSGFFFLEGFDFGVGMAVQTLAHNDDEKDQVVATIGPVWDGNEVWLLTAGGAMFASFPYWYASLFSGYYLILFTILFGLIIRGVSLNSAITCRKVNVVGCGTGRYQLVVSLYRSSLVFCLSA